MTAAAPATASARHSARPPRRAAKSDDDEAPKLSLPTEADRVAWQQPGFRLGLGVAYGRLRRPARRAEWPAPRCAAARWLAARCRWSLIASFQYASASGRRRASGLRFAGTLDPTWHVTPSFSLAVGFGFGGIVEGRTSASRCQPAGRARRHRATRSPNAHTPLPSCSGVGVAGLARAEYAWVLGPRSQTWWRSRSIGQYTGCVETPGASSPTPRQSDRAPPVLGAPGVRLAVGIAWR